MISRRKFLSALALSSIAAATKTKPTRSGLYDYNPARRLPWSQGAQYTSDTYPWHVVNSQANNRLFLNGSQIESESGALDMDMPTAWSNGAASKFPVAVIDSLGFDQFHQCLFPNVYHAEDYGGGPPIVHNHGTQVAGLIGATGHNPAGAVGMCWKVPLILLSTNARQGYTDWVLSIAWALDRAGDLGAKVICIPQGLPGDEWVRASLEYAASRDILVLCAAVNQPRDHNVILDYPTAWRLPNVLTISNCMRDGRLLPGGAGWGSETVFAGAPGRRLPVLLAGNRYGFASGTSEATGVAAGLAALVRSRWPEKTVAEIKTKMQTGILPVPALEGLTITGGMLHANALVPEETGIVKDLDSEHF